VTFVERFWKDQGEHFIASYRAVTPAARQAAVRADIARFLADVRDVETEFQGR
jgi:hypothetical protein